MYIKTYISYKHTYMHTYAYILENTYPINIRTCIHMQEGFFYDTYTGNVTLSLTDAPEIEKAVTNITAQKQTFER